jgi:hypothetical protein
MNAPIRPEQVLAIGTTPGSDPGSKVNPDVAKTQAIINVSEVLKVIALILIEIRDGKR